MTKKGTFGPKIAKNKKKSKKFQKSSFSKSIPNHLKHILKRKYRFRKFFAWQNFQGLSYFLG